MRCQAKDDPIVRGLVLVLLLSGCTNMPYVRQNETSVQYRSPLVPQRMDATINVLFVGNPREFCGDRALACARKNGGVWNIYTLKPRDWNDISRLATLGHEVMHALEAEHERIGK